MDQLYSKVNLTPLLDIIFLLLFLFIGSVSQREQQSLDRADIEREAANRQRIESKTEQRRLQRALEAEQQSNLALQAKNEAITAAIPRSMAAEQALSRQFAVYEIWLDPDHWVRLKSPKGPTRRQRVDSEILGEFLGGRVDKKRTVVLFFQSPRSIWADVTLISAALRKGGWIWQEYTLSR